MSAARRHTLDFDPVRDGFAFPNRFVWTDDDLEMLAGSLRPLASLPVAAGGAAGGALAARRRGAAVGALAGGALGWFGAGDRLVRAAARRWPTFGLCGGMALAAIERWPRRGRLATHDLEKEPIRALLRRRQEATLRASLGLFARYWALVRFVPGTTPDAPLADELRRELDQIEETIAGGRPVLLGLVGDAPDPFALHQVVAFGIERRGPLDATLDVYDPNALGQTRHVTTSAGRPGRTAIWTDMPTGSRPGGGFHVSTRTHHLSHVFAIHVPDSK